jgi:DNA-binding transcriptional regulator YiaG
VRSNEEGIMGNLETMIRSQIIRLARREMRKVTVPLSRDVRTLKNIVSKLRKSTLALERFSTEWRNEQIAEKAHLKATAEEIKEARFSPRLIRLLRERLGITQKELATLTGVTVGAIHQWEKGTFDPRNDKKGALVALRKLGRREVKRLLEAKKEASTKTKKELRGRPPRRRRRRVTKRR